MATTETELYDVVAVNMDTNKVRIIAKNKTLANAEAITKIAVLRRGVVDEFFSEVPSNKKFKDGDCYEL